MNKIKKIAGALAITSLLLVPTSMTADAYSTSPSGSAYDLTFNGIGWTVAMANCKRKSDCGTYSIDDMGNGEGDIYYGVYCSEVGGLFEEYCIFIKAKTYEFRKTKSGIWGVDGKNTSLSKERTNVNVSWDLE